MSAEAPLAPLTCDYCGRPGSIDASGSYRRQGRRGQGAMSGQWAPAEYSATLDAVACPECFKREFYKGKKP